MMFSAQIGFGRARTLPRRLLSRPWTADELTALSECFDQGMSVSKIARRLKRTPSSVQGKLNRLGHRRFARRRQAAASPCDLQHGLD
jgi:predicted transcriptional regulator with HTH domain